MSHYAAPISSNDGGEEDWLLWAQVLIPERFPTGTPIDGVLLALTERQRKILYLRVVGLTYEEIRQLLWPHPSIVSLHRSMRKIRSKLEALIGDGV